MITYHQYTAADVRAWLYDGATNGLCEQIISKVRADALLHNPCVMDATVLLFVAKNGEEIVGYTAQFPEHYVKPNMWFIQPTTLYVKPQYEGEFIGYALNERLHAIKNDSCVMGIDMAPQAALIDKLLGMNYIQVNRTRWIFQRQIKICSFRSLVSSVFEPIRLFYQKKAIAKLEKLKKHNIRVEYTNFIDTETYSFICAHTGVDTFLRSQEMLNWILHYPFVVESVLHGEKQDICEFGATESLCRRYLSKVYKDKTLIGTFLLIQHTNKISIGMLYTNDTYADDVYSILLRSVVSLHPQYITSFYSNLDTYIATSKVPLKKYIDQINMTYDTKLNYNYLQLQGIDGDMFC